MGAFRMLNVSVLPVQYNDKFYADMVTTPHDFTKMGKCSAMIVVVVVAVAVVASAVVVAVWVLLLCGRPSLTA